MILKIFTVHDSKAEAYLPPFHMPSRGLVIRAFTESVNDPKTSFYKYPSDFTLFEIGEYDDQKGTITSYTTKQAIGLALDYVTRTAQTIQDLRDAFNASPIGDALMPEKDRKILKEHFGVQQ